MTIMLVEYAAHMLIPFSLFFFFFVVLLVQCLVSPPKTKKKRPLLGMLPLLLKNASQIHDYATQVLRKKGGTSHFKGPKFTNMDFVITSDPVNVHHILSKNFANYPKGADFKQIFEPLGDGIFNADSDSWQKQRKTLHSLMKNSKFEKFVVKNVHQKLLNGLFPLLDLASSNPNAMIIDMQDVLQRFMFDTTCLMALGFDPHCLSTQLPEIPHAKAFDVMEETLYLRHIVPHWVWKIQKWLQIGNEKKLTIAWKTFDDFIYRCISTKRQQLLEYKDNAEEDFDLISAYMQQEYENDKFLRDTTSNLFTAGRDTVSAGLTWFLWLVTNHPSIKNTILQEIKENLVVNSNGVWRFFNAEELTTLVYLHAALCETMRLYPPIPNNHKSAVEADTLPSGHYVSKNQKVLISFYAMGRMEEIWGDDCMEFKPERWISDKGSLIHVPSYKFVAFNAGPRTCLGKDTSFIEMKIVAVALLCNYNLQVVEGHHVCPNNSAVLHMKYGLKVRVTRKNE